MCTFQLNKHDIDPIIASLKNKKAVTFLYLRTRQQTIINNDRFHSLSRLSFQLNLFTFLLKPIVSPADFWAGIISP